MNLKGLIISHNPIKSLANLKFPPFLEEVIVVNCKLTTIDGVVLPKLLRTLYLNDNNISSLRKVTFPDLKFLNISMNMLPSMSKVNLPSTLETLSAKGQPIKHWSTTNLPRALEEWNLVATEDPLTLTLPPTFSMQLEGYSRSQFLKLTLPGTLFSLILMNQYGAQLDIGLPSLRSKTL